LLLVGDIEWEGGGFAARGADLVDQFVQLLLIARGDGYGCALLCEAERAGASDALRGAGDDGDVS
jgi:hypothetical protein